MSNRLLSRGLTERMLFPHVQDREFIHYGYGVWVTIIGHKKFKYFVMGGDPGVVMQSSYYPEWKAKAHVLANVESGAGFIASQIDEVLFRSS